MTYCHNLLRGSKLLVRGFSLALASRLDQGDIDVRGNGGWLRVCSHKVRDETCCRGSKTLRNKSARGSKEGRLTSLCTDDQEA